VTGIPTATQTERWGIIEIGKNPVSLVRVQNASKRLKRPRILEVDQFFELLKHLSEPYRTMVLVAQCLGLRINEILGLKWGDFDFENRTVLVQRSVVGERGSELMRLPPIGSSRSCPRNAAKTLCRRALRPRTRLDSPLRFQLR
jgi:integrase